MPYSIARITVLSCDTSSLGHNLASLMTQMQTMLSPMIRAYDAYGCATCFACTINKVGLTPWGSKHTLDIDLGCFEDIEAILKLVRLSSNGEFEIGDAGTGDGYLFTVQGFSYNPILNGDFNCLVSTGDVRCHYPAQYYAYAAGSAAQKLGEILNKKPDPAYCDHEPVNVGFNLLRLACKKCDLDLPDDYKKLKWRMDDDTY